MRRETLITGQAYAAGHSLMRTGRLQRPVDVIFVSPTADVPVAIDDAIVTAHGAGLRAAVLNLADPATRKVVIPDYIPVYLEPPPQEADQKALAAAARAALPGVELLWTHAPQGGSGKERLGFSIDRGAP